MKSKPKSTSSTERRPPPPHGERPPRAPHARRPRTSPWRAAAGTSARRSRAAGGHVERGQRRRGRPAEQRPPPPEVHLVQRRLRQVGHQVRPRRREPPPPAEHHRVGRRLRVAVGHGPRPRGSDQLHGAGQRARAELAGRRTRHAERERVPVEPLGQRPPPWPRPRRSRRT